MQWMLSTRSSGGDAIPCTPILRSFSQSPNKGSSMTPPWLLFLKQCTHARESKGLRRGGTSIMAARSRGATGRPWTVCIISPTSICPVAAAPPLICAHACVSRRVLLSMSLHLCDTRRGKRETEMVGDKRACKRACTTCSLRVS